ncbi:MAG: hypothetical protein MJ133_07660 [Lachnospiraceae bacterium]|nr:hypothetical protein [Lachnospiraceae bacterium]
MNITINDLLVTMIRDLENTRYKYHGYAYRRTIRNILTGNKDAVIAPQFKGKSYYGLVKYLSLTDVESMLVEMVRCNTISVIYTDRGKLYCTNPYHNDICYKCS